MPLSCNQEKSSEATFSFLASLSGAGLRDCDHEGDDDDPLSAGESLGFAQLESLMAGGGNGSVPGFSAQSLLFLDGVSSAEETVQQRRGQQRTGKIDGLPAGVDLFEGPEGYGAMLHGRFKSAGNDPHAFMRALLWSVTADSAVKVTRRLITRELNNLADFVENRLADSAVSAWWNSTQWRRDGRPASPVMDELAAGKLAWNCDLTRLVRLYLNSGHVSEIFLAATSSAPHSNPGAGVEDPVGASEEPAGGSSGQYRGEQPNWEFFNERRWKFFTPHDSGYGFRGASEHFAPEAGVTTSDVDEEDDGYMTLLGFSVRRQTVRSVLHALMLTGDVAQQVQRCNAIPLPEGGFRSKATATPQSDAPSQMPYSESRAFDPDEETIIEFINDEGVPIREPSRGAETLVDRTGSVGAAPWMNKSTDLGTRASGLLVHAGHLMHDLVTYIKNWPDVVVSAAPQVAPAAAESSLVEQEASEAEAQLINLTNDTSSSLFGPSAYIRLRGILCNVHVSDLNNYDVYLHRDVDVTKIFDLSIPFLLHGKQYYPVVRSNGIPSDFLSGADAYVLTTYVRTPEKPDQEITVVFHFGQLTPLRVTLEKTLETIVDVIEIAAAGGALLAPFKLKIGTDDEKLAIKKRQDFHDYLERIAKATQLANYYFAARNDPKSSFISASSGEIHLIRNAPLKIQDSKYYEGNVDADRRFVLNAPSADITSGDLFRFFDFGQLAFDNGESTYKRVSASPGSLHWQSIMYFAEFSSFHPVTRAETIWEFRDKDQSIVQHLIDIVTLLTDVRKDIPGGAQINGHGWHWSLPAQQLAQGIPSQFVPPFLVRTAQRIAWNAKTSRIEIQHPWYFEQAGDSTDILLPSSVTPSTVFEAIDLGQLSDANGAPLYSKIGKPTKIRFGSTTASAELYVLHFEVKNRTGKKRRTFRILHLREQVLQRLHRELIGDSFIKPGPINAHCVGPKIVFFNPAVEDDIFDLRPYERFSAPGERYEILLTRDIELPPPISWRNAHSDGDTIVRLPEKLFHDDGTALVWVADDHAEIEDVAGQFLLSICMVPSDADPYNHHQWLSFTLKSTSKPALEKVKSQLDLVMQESVTRRGAHLDSLFGGKTGRNPAFARVHAHDEALPWNKLTSTSAIKHLVLEFVDVERADIRGLFSKLAGSGSLRFIESRIGRVRELAFYYTSLDGAYSVPVIIIGANEWVAADLLSRTRGNDPMRAWRSSCWSDATDSSQQSDSLPLQSPDFQRGTRIVLWNPAQNRLEIPQDWSGTAFLAQPSYLEVPDWGDVSDVQVTVQEPFFRQTGIGGEIVMWNEGRSQCLFIQKGHGDIEVAQAIAKASESRAKSLQKSSLLSSAKRGVSIPTHAFSALQNMDSERVRLFDFHDDAVPPTIVSEDVEKYRVFFKEVFPDQIYSSVFGKEDDDFGNRPFGEAAESVLIAMDIFDFRMQLSTKSPRDWRVALGKHKSPLSLDGWVKVRPLLLSHTGLRKIERLCKAKGLSKCQSFAGGQSSRTDRGRQPPVVAKGAQLDGPVKAEADRLLANIKPVGREFNDIELHNVSADDGRMKTLGIAKMVIVGTGATGSGKAGARMFGSGLVSLGSFGQLLMASLPEGSFLSQTVGWTSIIGTAGLTASYGTYAALDNDSPQLAIWGEQGAVGFLIISNGLQSGQDVVSFIQDPSFMNAFVVFKDTSNLVSALASMPDADAFLMKFARKPDPIGTELATPVSRQDVAATEQIAAFDENAVDFSDVPSMFSEYEIDEMLTPELAEAIDALMFFADPTGASEGVVLAGSVEEAMELWTYARQVEAVAEVVPGVGLLADVVVEGVIATIAQYLLEIAVGTAALGAIMGNAESEAKQLQDVKAQAVEHLKSRAYSEMDESKLGKSHAEELKALQKRFKDDVVEELETSRRLVESCKTEHGGIFRMSAHAAHRTIENALKSIPFWDALVRKLAADVQDDILKEVSKAAENEADQAILWKEAIAGGFAMNSPDNFGGMEGQGAAAAEIADTLTCWDNLVKFEEAIRRIHLPDCNAMISGNPNTIIYHGKLGKH